MNDLVGIFPWEKIFHIASGHENSVFSMKILALVENNGFGKFCRKIYVISLSKRHLKD